MATPQYWLIKTEPQTYGIEHLQKDGVTPWSGVRNYQARNFMRDDMHVGDQVLFYHSSCLLPGVYGLATVASSAYADPTQFDESSEYFDARSTPEKPRWHVVDMAFSKDLKHPVLLSAIRAKPALSGMRLLAPGNRLSIMPITKGEYAVVLGLAGERGIVLRDK